MKYNSITKLGFQKPFLIISGAPVNPIPNQKTTRNKRANGLPANFFVEYLVVLDSTIFQKYAGAYSQLNNNTQLVLQYLKIHFSHLVNAVCNH